MSTANVSSTDFSTAAIHVVGQYNDAGKTLVGAYRSGAHRLLGGAASRFARLGKVTGFLGNRLDIDTSRIVNLMDRVATGTTSGIASVANVAARIESPLGSSMLKTLGSIHQPMATVSVQIADRVAAGARQIESRVAGTPALVKAARTVKAKGKPVARRAARVTRKA